MAFISFFHALGTEFTETEFNYAEQTAKAHWDFLSSHDLIKYFMPSRKPVEAPSLHPTT